MKFWYNPLSVSCTELKYIAEKMSEAVIPSNNTVCKPKSKQYRKLNTSAP